jgi:hypothetical protein
VSTLERYFFYEATPIAVIGFAPGLVRLVEESSRHVTFIHPATTWPEPPDPERGGAWRSAEPTPQDRVSVM